MASDNEAGLYARMSYDKNGEELGVTRQKDELTELAERYGLTILDRYIDNDRSASKDTVIRPQYNRLVRDYNADRCSHILVWDIDRLSRRPLQLEQWLESGEKRGTRWYTTEKVYDLTNRDDRQYIRLKAMMARNEIDLKAARQRAANKQRREMGKAPMSLPPYGYVSWSELDEVKADRIREVFRRYAEGDSVTGIVRWLNGELDDPRVPAPKSSHWSQQQVRRMLRNANYAALVSLRGELTGDVGQWPAIVAESTWRKVNHRLDDQASGLRGLNRDRKWLGTYFYRCAECDGYMRAHGNASYRCGGAGLCLCRSAKPVDAYVMDVVRERLGRPDFADILPRRQDDEAKTAAERVATLRERIEATERDYDDDLIDARTLNRKLGKLRPQLADAEQELTRYAASDALAAVAGHRDPVAAFDAQPIGIQRNVAASLMTVKLARGSKGRFDPATVIIDWLQAAPENERAGQAFRCPASLSSQS